MCVLQWLLDAVLEKEAALLEKRRVYSTGTWLAKLKRMCALKHITARAVMTSVKRLTVNRVSIDTISASLRTTWHAKQTASRNMVKTAILTSRPAWTTMVTTAPRPTKSVKPHTAWIARQTQLLNRSVKPTTLWTARQLIPLARLITMALISSSLTNKALRQWVAPL